MAVKQLIHLRIWLWHQSSYFQECVTTGVCIKSPLAFWCDLGLFCWSSEAKPGCWAEHGGTQGRAWLFWGFEGLCTEPGPSQRGQWLCWRQRRWSPCCRVCVPPLAPKVCPCPRGCVLLHAWGCVRESDKNLCVLAAPPKGCFPWGGGQRSPLLALPVLLGVHGPSGGLGALWGLAAPIWGSAGHLHLSGAVSQCRLRSLLLPQRHGAVLEKELLMEKKTKRKAAIRLF